MCQCEIWEDEVDEIAHQGGVTLMRFPKWEDVVVAESDESR